MATQFIKTSASIILFICYCRYYLFIGTEILINLLKYLKSNLGNEFHLYNIFLKTSNILSKWNFVCLRSEDVYNWATILYLVIWSFSHDGRYLNPSSLVSPLSFWGVSYIWIIQKFFSFLTLYLIYYTFNLCSFCSIHCSCCQCLGACTNYVKMRYLDPISV